MEKIKYLDLYSNLIKTRLFEEKLANILENSPGEIKTPCHLYIGQEAVSVGICDNLSKDDYVFGNHRSHGYYISMGGDINALMAEIYGKSDGCSKGRGGSMHIADIDNGMVGSTAIVAGTISLALGAALSSQISDENKVAVTFFGDGAVNEGVLFESINFAVLKKLPLVFVCENNLYATHVPIKSHLSNTNISELVRGFNIKSVRLDGNNLIEMQNESAKLIEEARSGKGPVFIECLTYRQRGHVGPNYDTNKGLREKKELDEWMEKCPIKLFEKHVLENNILNADELKDIFTRINEEIEQTVIYAKNSKELNKNDLLNLVFNNK